MKTFRFVLVITLALVMTLWMALATPVAAKTLKPTTYTSEQLTSLQEYNADLSALRERMPELAALIQKQDWVFVRNFIRGPLGELRFKMATVTSNLLPDAQAKARKLSKTIFSNLEAIDQAADAAAYKAAIRNYAETIRDFDEFLKLIPQG